ncbi:MAG: dTDP-glucose 4,6-dehydratase [Planctomycetes bacterium]|nr:dTDP-glucose 4,6-dehydratase [Planctomycetota bacterium]MCH8258935.1 dTDP-glucose 4,6-dehydratase [Planctomycetota bacterium]
MAGSERRILITGGAGFIGSNFVRFVMHERPRWRIVNYDALTYAGNPANLADVADDPRYEFVHGDIRDRDDLVHALSGCDSVVHFAAESHVDRSIADASPFVSTNVLGTQVLLDACRELGTIERFVHIGTDEVYGELPLDRPDLKFTEQTPLKPNSPYSASKAAADLLALSYHTTFDLPVVVTRCSNNFGPYQYPEKVIPLFVTNLIDGQKVPLYGDGLNVRDWLHVIDHCEAVLAVLERGELGEVYNIGGNNEQSNIKLTHTILDLIGCGKDMIQPVEDRLGHDRRYAIDSTKIQSELGWRATRSTWPEALAQTIDWYKSNESWWRPLKQRTSPTVA